MLVPGSQEDEQMATVKKMKVILYFKNHPISFYGEYVISTK